MEDMVIDENALSGMKSLLGEQFGTTLTFCYSEFDRLNLELNQSIKVDSNSAIRHAHSLKSNAAQFGALSLAEMAKNVEHSLSKGNLEEALAHASLLQTFIEQTKNKINTWKLSATD
ncbi:Hpt domain-containing protein [Pseudoalteromonas denitrificans]|uniref:Hpt domain-containing protein n=1 Tax=Pseudoalteromonas denitrificans DSM 6059 TaxID=1123010 RepID=A0A1I1MHQ3_9GAMM|nr:Hpt domain-containing protein [Pseudoalteromonas denitrificans]SFC85014.1 Hpt domain-containing protein [Pseudoalteromonas denitrificans DSM 6059]